MAMSLTACDDAANMKLPTGKDATAAALSEDPDKRVAAINAWSNHEWGLKGDYLKFYAAAARQDDSAVVRSAAVRALGKAKDPAYVPEIAACMKDPVVAVRMDAAWALDRVLGEAAIEPLRAAALADPSTDVRVAAIKAIRHYRLPNVVEALVACLDDKSFGVRLEAHGSLVYITGEDRGTEADDWRPLVGKPVPPRKEPRPWWKIGGGK